MTGIADFADPYEAVLYRGCTLSEVDEIQQLMQGWNKATYPSKKTSF